MGGCIGGWGERERRGVGLGVGISMDERSGWVLPHVFNYDISKTSLLYRLFLICFLASEDIKQKQNERTNGWLKCCFTSTETVGLLETGAQDVHLDFHTAPEL